jgi:hypothetical protein
MMRSIAREAEPMGGRCPAFATKGDADDLPTNQTIRGAAVSLNMVHVTADRGDRPHLIRRLRATLVAQRGLTGTSCNCSGVR